MKKRLRAKAALSFLLAALLLLCGVSSLGAASLGEPTFAAQKLAAVFEGQESVPEDQATVREFATGALESQTRPTYAAPPAGGSRKYVAAAPAKVDLSTTGYLPPVGDQGSIGSCGSWASTYYQFTYQVARMMDWDASDPAHQFSPKWNFNYINNGSSLGSYADDAYRNLQFQGAATWQDFPYTDAGRNKDYLEWCTDIDVMRRALCYRVSDYQYQGFAAWMEETPIRSNTSPCLINMKELLAQGKPLVVTADVGSTANASFGDWNFVTVPGYGRVATSQWDRTGRREGHAITIVGYDDTLSYDLNANGSIEDYERGAFKIVNSWGTVFENQGFVWVMYDALNQVSNVAAQNNENRHPIFEYYGYYTINVAEYTPRLTAEVTLNQRSREKIRLSLAEYDTWGVFKRHTPLLNYSGGTYAFDGTTIARAATFCFDFEPLLGEDWQDKDWCVIIDDYGVNTYTTTVSSVKILKNGTEIMSQTPGEAFTSSTRIYSTSQAAPITMPKVNISANDVSWAKAADVTQDTHIPVYNTGEGGRYYRFTPAATGVYTISSYMTGVMPYRRISVYEADETFLGELFCVEDSGSGYIPLTAGQTYYLAANGMVDSAYTFIISSAPSLMEVGVGAPSVAPGQIIAAEATHTEISAKPSLTYQWQRKNQLFEEAWQNIPSATNPTYTTGLTDAGLLVRVVVTSQGGALAAGQIHSEPVYVTPQITMSHNAPIIGQPIGAEVRLAVNAADFLKYHWMRRQSDADEWSVIADANAAIYTPGRGDLDQMLRVEVNGVGYGDELYLYAWTPGAPVGPVAADALRLGDLYGDRMVDIDSILAVRAHIFGTRLLTGHALSAADILGDGVIDIDTILALRAHIFGTALLF